MTDLLILDILQRNSFVKQTYTPFVVEASTPSYIEESQGLAAQTLLIMRAVMGWSAEYTEFKQELIWIDSVMSANMIPDDKDVADLREELGDTLFWVTVLMYHANKFSVDTCYTNDKPDKLLTNTDIIDKLEKWSRNPLGAPKQIGYLSQIVYSVLYWTEDCLRAKLYEQITSTPLQKESDWNVCILDVLNENMTKLLASPRKTISPATV